MITNKMITKLATAYTKRSLANEGPKVASSVWSNGLILFWESPPDFVANHYSKEEKPLLDNITIPNEMPALYPVEIRGHDSISFPCVRMTDGNGRTCWLNARLVVSMIKQTKHTNQVTFAWFAGDAEGKAITGVAAMLLDRPLALIGQLNDKYLGLDEHAPDWQLINEDLPMPVYHARPEYIDTKKVTQYRLL